MSNSKNTSFIPYQNHSVIEGYSMIEDFGDNNNGLKKIGEKYKEYLNGLIPGEVTPNDKALSKAIENLKYVIERERNEELNFLNELGKLLNTNLSDDKNIWKSLIEGFNTVFSVEKVFKNNIQKIVKMGKNNGAGKYQDITRLLDKEYLPKAIQEYRSQLTKLENLNEDVLLKIMKRAVELMFQANASNRKVDRNNQPYLEMFEAIQNLSHENEIFKNLVSLFKLDEYLKNNLDNFDKMPKISASKTNAAGDVYEEIEAAVLTDAFKTKKFFSKSGIFELNGEIIRTGSTGQKADNVIVMAEGKIDTSPLTSGASRIDNSVRLRSIQRMEELLENIGEQKAKVIFISDKNYVIGNNTHFGRHGGFTAQDITLNQLLQYGAEFHIPNVEDMINYLASAGDKMIVNETEGVLEVIETCIGNFLFDDLHIEVPSAETNRVHLLSLSGIYMPASVYLEATLKGLLNIDGYNKKDFVQTSYNPEYKEPEGSSLSSWNNYMSYMKKQNIHISFMSGYVKFMTDLFK